MNVFKYSLGRVEWVEVIMLKPNPVLHGVCDAGTGFHTSPDS